MGYILCIAHCHVPSAIMSYNGTKKAPEQSDANIFIYAYSLYIHHNQNPSIFS